MDNFSGKVRIEKVFLLKSSTHQNVVAAIPLRRDENLSSWSILPLKFGEVGYTSSYWEWTLNTYDHNENVLQVFCENWRPSTNTVSTFVEKLSISLWDLRTIGGLSVHEWTKFWFRGSRKYVEPSPRTSKSRTKPRMNHDPSGNIDMSFLPRNEEDSTPFFVLLNKKDDCIHASVFKVASLMAHGEIIFLAVSVLASIYRGLKDILTYSNLDACDILLPIHYVHGWIGLRSSFVTLRLDDELIVEPYSPHRFSRQFGYCLDVPGALIEQDYDGSLLALVQLWDSCVHLGSSLKIIIPMRPSNKGGSKKDDASLPTKGEQLQEKLPHSLKSKVTPNIPPQSVKVVSKSKNSKVKDIHVDNGVKRPLQTPKVANITDNSQEEETFQLIGQKC
ncbi:hypothetical protein H5410_046545 [Solanum commersonii]|uniref:Aminotransferase-like plant mobile domain-containing protein n=1 Tax=Solanum commersonii TaxID=4109 RepID=A0A9J5XEQ6_SOLCO|nr:hypothetical protein H5410_046545 [Solanum commersonii]